MQNLDPVFSNAEKSTLNPFLDDVFAPGITDLPGVADIHGDVLNHCVKAFENLLRENRQPNPPQSSSGRTILIAAPRAGYGKSHLVGRIRSVTESLITAVSLPLDPIRQVSWNAVLESLINQYRSGRCPQNLGCTLFDETARFFQSSCVRLAMEHGALDEKEVPETEIAMRVQFRDVFDPKAGKNRLTTWFAKRSSEIIDVASRSLCERWRIGFDDLVFWNRFFQEHAHPKANPFVQLQDLPDAAARQRLTEFLRIATDCRPAAFVADHLDGFFGSESAGMEIARILTSLREEIPQSITLLCLNEDLWQSVFEKRLPSAWIDRLTADAVPLKGISIASAEALLEARLHAVGITGPGASGFLSCFRQQEGWDDGIPNSPIYPRELFRAAARLWDQAPKETAPASPVRPPIPDVPSPVMSRKNEPESDLPKPVPNKPFQARPPAAETDSAKAARAAGKDLTSGLTDIESIIADIRGAGVKSVSESGRGSSGFRRTGRINGDKLFAKENNRGASSSLDRNPFWARNLEKRLQEIESGALAGNEALHWEPARLSHLIRAVGERFPAVGQTELRIAGPQGGDCLRWQVRKSEVILGFEPPSNLLYWKALLQQIETTGAAGPMKIAVLSNSSAPFDFRALAGIGTDPATVSRFFDIMEVGEKELRRLYAAESFLREAEAADQADAAVRVIARRLDSFWRRLTRPLRPARPASS